MSSLTLTLIQSSLHWENKEANRSHFGSIIRGLTEKTEVVVLPEMFSTGFSMKPEAFAETMDGETVNWMKSIAAEKRIILTGSIMVKEGDAYFNRLIWMLPNGQYGYYDKRHLFGYAGEDNHYAPGSKRFIASVKGWKILLLVCYDLRFPVWSRQQGERLEDGSLSSEYDMILYVANWPERRNHAWKTLLQARAIENQCYVVGVNRVGKDGQDIYHSGDSMIVDPMGEVLHTHAHGEWVHTVTLQKEHLEAIRTKLPFLKDGDDFLIQT
jgi:omega-amidase